MSISHLLEDFGAYTRGKPVSLTDVSLEEQKLEAFEKGYQAGWDDCAKAESEDQRSISVALAQNLKDLSFTYHEAQSAVLQSLRPLLEQIMQTVLPEIMQKTLGLQIVELLQDLAREHGNPPVGIVISPADFRALDGLIDQDSPMPITLSEEPSLAEGQAYLRFADQEREIDLNGVLSSIEQAVNGFFKLAQEESA